MSFRISELQEWKERLDRWPQGARILHLATISNQTYDPSCEPISDLIEYVELVASNNRWHEFHSGDVSQMKVTRDLALKTIMQFAKNGL